MQNDSHDPNIALFIKKTYEILEVHSKISRILITLKLFTGFLRGSNSPSKILINFRQIFYPLSSDIATFTPLSDSLTCMASISHEKNHREISLVIPISKKEEQTFSSQSGGSWKTSRRMKKTTLWMSHIQQWNLQLSMFCSLFYPRINKSTHNLNSKRKILLINAKSISSQVSLSWSCKAWCVLAK